MNNYRELQNKNSKVYSEYVSLKHILQQTENNIMIPESDDTIIPESDDIMIPESDNLSNNICKICFNDTEIDDFINLTCNHKLCKDCFQKWHKTCPWCRSVIKIPKNTLIDNSNDSYDSEDCCNDPKCQICKLFTFIVAFGYITYNSIYLNYK